MLRIVISIFVIIQFIQVSSDRTPPNSPYNIYVRPGFKFNNRNDTKLSDVLLDTVNCNQLFFDWIKMDVVQDSLMKGKWTERNLKLAYKVMRDVTDWLYPPLKIWINGLNNLKQSMNNTEEKAFIDMFVKGKSDHHSLMIYIFHDSLRSIWFDCTPA